MAFPGRLFCFKVLLKKHKKSDCAVAYGIGHGGIEVVIIVGMSYLYPLAILIHAMIDAPAAMYQYQVLHSLVVVEGIAFLMGIVTLTLGRYMTRRYENG